MYVANFCLLSSIRLSDEYAYTEHYSITSNALTAIEGCCWYSFFLFHLWHLYIFISKRNFIHTRNFYWIKLCETTRLYFVIAILSVDYSQLSWKCFYRIATKIELLATFCNLRHSTHIFIAINFKSLVMCHSINWSNKFLDFLI